MKTDNVAKRRLRKSLKSQGLRPEAIEKAVLDTFGGHENKLTAIPRSTVKNIVSLFNRSGKPSVVVVSWGKTGKFRAYSGEGFKNLLAVGKKAGMARAARYRVVGAAKPVNAVA